MVPIYMKRRKFVQSLVAVTPAVVVAQQVAPPSTQPPATPQQPVEPPIGAAGRGGRGAGAGMEDTTKLEITSADAVGQMTPHFFNADQYLALEKLSQILLPPLKGAPGALDAQAPQFLDFLLGESPADRQQLYRQGLDALNAQARKKFQQAFAKLSDDQAAQLLEPLRQPWTYDPPADPLTKFLRAAKQDVRTATVNSREFSVAGNAAGGGGRRFGGTGLYWNSLDS